jgi:hypothetical protein
MHAVRRSRVIGDYRGYRRLIAYIAVFDRMTGTGKELSAAGEERGAE